jgi:hypothetical protein
LPKTISVRTPKTIGAMIARRQSIPLRSRRIELHLYGSLRDRGSIELGHAVENLLPQAAGRERGSTTIPG